MIIPYREEILQMVAEGFISVETAERIFNAQPVEVDEQGRQKTLYGLPIVWKDDRRDPPKQETWLDRPSLL